ncbi:hypothetical protein [Kitasatospora sp. NPDC088351]|uniref:hypothetical protein n=1 Tax=unclassified Kitasatospora TaxID=2633591 RepID=UPI003427B5B5
MNERTAEVPGARVRPDGRMTEQDTERFRALLARLEHSLAADRRTGPAAVASRDV